VANQVGDGAKRGQDQDVNLGMAEEPEEMLVEGGISTPSGIKEG